MWVFYMVNTLRITNQDMSLISIKKLDLLCRTSITMLSGKPDKEQVMILGKKLI